MNDSASHITSADWASLHVTIQGWLQERQDLIVRFCDLVGVRRFEEVEAAVVQFRQFCQVLVDYISAGHFEIYQQLLGEAEDHADGSIEFGRKIVPLIQVSTDAALNFNDAFDQTPEELDELNQLLPVLADLGVALEERFELEDSLIERLHNAHAAQTTTA